MDNNDLSILPEELIYEILIYLDILSINNVSTLLPNMNIINNKYFWINKMEADTHRKFETLDKLAQDLFTRQRFAEYIKWNR